MAGQRWMLVIFVAFNLIWTHQCYGFFFGMKEMKTASFPVAESCAALAETGDCRFFLCFDRRFPCERHNYALHEGWRFCSAVEDHIDKLNEAGKTLARQTRTCVMTKLLEKFYRQPSVNCEQIVDTGRSTFGDCFVRNNGCSIRLWANNRKALPHLLSLSRHSLSRVLQGTRKCGFMQWMRLADWLRQNVLRHFPHTRQ